MSNDRSFKVFPGFVCYCSKLVVSYCNWWLVIAIGMLMQQQSRCARQQGWGHRNDNNGVRYIMILKMIDFKFM